MELRTRTCNRCGKSKPLTGEFFLQEPRSSEGFRRICKVCTNAQRHGWERSRDHYIGSQAGLEQELVNAPLAAAKLVLEQNPHMVQLIMRNDPILFKALLREVRFDVLRRMTARREIYQEIAKKTRANLKAGHTSEKRFQCDQCELITSPGSLGKHQKHSGHEGRTYVGTVVRGTDAELPDSLRRVLEVSQ